MKKRLLVALLSFGLLFSVAQTNAGTGGLLSMGAESSSTSSGMIGVLIEAFGDLQTLSSQLTEEEANLNFEQTFEFPSLVEMARNQELIDKKNADIISLEDKRAELDEVIADTKDSLTAVLQKQIDFANDPGEDTSEEDIEKKITEYDEDVEEIQATLDEHDATQVEYDTEIKVLELEMENLIDQQPELEKDLAERQMLQIENIEQYEKNIDQVLEQIGRQKRLVESQLIRAGISMAVFAGAILLLFFIRFFVAKIIKRFYSNITEKRKKALIKLSRITFNVIIGIAILTILFAQFASLLPFLLLLGTGFAFAVRDSISSFIGWFVIGTDNGFKLGDTIKIGDAYGQVKEISSLNTVLWEIRDGVRTGKSVTFPNKRIFDQSLINYSRSFKVNRIQLSFWVSSSSDLETIQGILMPLMTEVHNKFEKEIGRVRGLNDEEKLPIVTFESHEKHIKVLAQVFVPVEERAAVQMSITEAFMKEAQKNRKVQLGE